MFKKMDEGTPSSSVPILDGGGGGGTSRDGVSMLPTSPSTSSSSSSSEFTFDVSLHIYYLLALTLVIILIALRNFIWIVIKTGHRDLKSLLRLLQTKWLLYGLKKSNGNVITVFRSNVSRHPNKTIFYYNDEKWSFRDLELYTNKVANAFISAGFKPGDEVALLMDSRPEYVGMWLGLAKAGIITALINTNQRGGTLIHSITVINCKALIFGPEYLDAVEEIIPGVNERRASITYFCLGDINSNNHNSNGGNNGSTATRLDVSNGTTLSIGNNGNANGNNKVMMNGLTSVNGHNNSNGNGYKLRNGYTNGGHNGSGDHRFNSNGNKGLAGAEYMSKYSSTTIKSIPIIALHQMVQSASSDASLIEHHPNFTDRLFYIYTSGTTGLPKAAIIKHCRYIWIGSALRNLSGIPRGNIIYTCIPLYHLSGGVLGTNQCLIWGDSMVIRPKFSASKFWEDCIKYNCNMAQYIGEICRYLMAQPERPTDKQHKVRMMFGNGLRPEIWGDFVRRFNIKQVGEFYGSTEGNANIINNTNKEGACGFISQILPRVYPVALIRVDEKTREPIRGPDGLCIKAGPGESGEFIGKIILNDASRAFDGYVDSEATAKKIIRDVYVKGDAAFLSGDLLTMDDLGYVYFKDRTGDTFRWKGENVSTTQVEGIISNILKLRDCVVYGVDIAGVEGKAGMVAIPDPEKCINLSHFHSSLKKSLPNYAIPCFVRIVDELQTTGTYKLPKSMLQKEGYDPSLIHDPLFFLDPRSQEFVRMTPDLYNDIINCKIRL